MIQRRLIPIQLSALRIGKPVAVSGLGEAVGGGGVGGVVGGGSDVRLKNELHGERLSHHGAAVEDEVMGA